MASITHTVIYGDLGCPPDLRHIAVNSRDVVYKTKPFNVINWHHKKLGVVVCCIVLENDLPWG